MPGNLCVAISVAARRILRQRIPLLTVTHELESQPDIPPAVDRRLAVAPMLDWTDRIFRYFARLMTRRTLLYTEMLTTSAILHGDRDRLLRFDPSEHPVALQVGGSDPEEMAACARIAEDWGYDEVNINLGCPSERVQAARFGACLMAEPARVADCIRRMVAAVSIPVTVKTRIGIDDQDSYGDLASFVGTLAQAGCRTFVVHARKAWLQGLSPKENREIPPLRHDRVLRLKQDFPDLEIILNGGVRSIQQAAGLLDRLDGVMIGRAAYETPWILAEADPVVFGEPGPGSTRHEVIDGLIPFVELELRAGTPLNRMTRHLLGLFHGVPGARAWRRHLSERAHLSGAGSEVIREAARLVPLA